MASDSDGWMDGRTDLVKICIRVDTLACDVYGVLAFYAEKIWGL